MVNSGFARIARPCLYGLVVPIFSAPTAAIHPSKGRLTREIAEIDELFYRGSENEDRLLYAGMLERKRDDMVRSAVLQMHTAIEDILNSLIICRLLNAKPENRKGKMRNKSGIALRKMLFGAESIGFDMKLNLAVALGLLNETTKKKAHGA